MNKKLFGIGCAVLGLVLAAISMMVLPDTVGVQIGLDGNISNTMPKFLAVLIPFGLTLAGSFMSYKGEENTSKGFIISVVGIAVMVITLIVNR